MYVGKTKRFFLIKSHQCPQISMKTLRQAPSIRSCSLAFPSQNLTVTFVRFIPHGDLCPEALMNILPLTFGGDWFDYNAVW